MRKALPGNGKLTLEGRETVSRGAKPRTSHLTRIAAVTVPSWLKRASKRGSKLSSRPRRRYPRFRLCL